MAFLEAQPIDNSGTHEGNVVQLYRFPYKRIYDSDGNITSYPISVNNVDGRRNFTVRKTNLIEDAAMYFQEHPLLEFVCSFLITSSIFNLLNQRPDVAFLEALAGLAAVAASGLSKELQAKDQGVAPQYAKPVKIVGL